MRSSAPCNAAPTLPSPGAASVDRHIDRKTKAQAERVVAKILDTIEILEHYANVDAVADLLARGAETADVDGYPAGSSGQSDIHGGRMSDPTGRAVEHMAGGRYDERQEMALSDDTWEHIKDQLRQFVVEFGTNITEMHGLAKRSHKMATVVIHAADRHRGRQSSLQGDCLRCQKPVSGVGNDRMRTGLCPSCANDFYETRTGRQTTVAEWLGMNHPEANRRAAPPASRDEVATGVTWHA